MSVSLAALVDEFLAEEMEESPTAATAFGIDGHDDRLGEFTASDFERRERNARAWLDRFEAVGDDALTLDDRIDRDLAISALRGRVVMEDWALWQRDPNVYLSPCMSGVFLLFLNRVHPEPDLVRFATERLRLVPAVLDAARENLDPAVAPALLVQRAMGSARAGVTYMRDLVPAEVDDPQARAALADAGAVAAGALEGFLAYLDELAATASGEWAIGERRYSQLLREKEGLAYDAAELGRRGAAAYDALSDELGGLAEVVGGSRDWQRVMTEVNRDHPATPEEMRDEYAAWTDRCRRFIAEGQFVTLPEGEACRVEPSPPFQRPLLAVASYSRPPAFKSSLTGTFFVPFPPDGTPDDEIQKRLSTNSRASIPTISAHEAYPGHHWHLVKVQANPHPIRKVLGTPYFTEGWALYAERLMREHGFFADPRHELAHLDARIFRAARIVVDTALHTGEMSVDEAVSFMSTKATLSEPTARTEVERYCAWPTQAASYLTGALEIERIRDRYLAEGRGDLRSFNDSIAGSGMLPIALAERAVLA